MRHWFASERSAYFFLLLGIGLLGVYIALEWRLPRADQLQTASGRVVWNAATRDAFYFALNGEPRRFVLYAKGDADGRMRDAARDAVLYPLKVSFAPAQVNSTGSGDYYTAYGIAVGGKAVASLADVRAAYRRDNLVALVMGLIFTLVGYQRARRFRAAAARAPAPPRRRPRSPPGGP